MKIPVGKSKQTRH